MSQGGFKYTSAVIKVPVVAIFLIWFIYLIELKFNLNFNKYGIYPNTFKGLRGILFSPFIHGDIKHLFNNSIPVAVLLGCLFYFYQKIATKVVVWGLLISGLLTWLIGRPSYHIGASGLVYLLVSFIFFSGVFRKYYRLIALSLMVVFLYGSLVWYVFPTEDRISWEGHLSGFIVGFVFAFLFRNRGPVIEKFEFSKNKEFESLFDEEGNFNPPSEEVDASSEEIKLD